MNGPADTVRPRRARRPDPMPFVAAVLLTVGAATLVLTRLPARPTAPARAASSRTPTGSVVLEALDAPTPLFASYRSLRLRLLVRPEDMTRIAYHQASGSTALAITSLLPDAEAAPAQRTAEAPATDAAEVYSAEQDDATVLRGNVLRLWRSGRHGFPDTAADIGADPGTPVYAPVSGKIIAVRAYRLYERWPDFEVHIQPDGWPEVDAVLIHVSGVVVRRGDRVEAGTTRVASVRKLSDRVNNQLAGYTDNGGDHVHLQLNRMRVPGRIERVGGS